MSGTAKAAGFTMIELMVTLVLIGLVAALAVPNIESWLGSRERAIARDHLSGLVAQLPLKAVRQGRGIVITEASQLEADTTLTLNITTPIEVQENGYCRGGALSLLEGGVEYAYVVTEPFCQLQLRGQ